MLFGYSRRSGLHICHSSQKFRETGNQLLMKDSSPVLQKYLQLMTPQKEKKNPILHQLYYASAEMINVIPYIYYKTMTNTSTVKTIFFWCRLANLKFDNFFFKSNNFTRIFIVNQIHVELFYRRLIYIHAWVWLVNLICHNCADTFIMWWNVFQRKGSNSVEYWMLFSAPDIWRKTLGVLKTGKVFILV